MSSNVFEREVQEFTYSVQIPDGAYITRKLKEGDTVAVGSDDTAELRLNSPGIAGMHCLLTVEEGRLSIKDCYSPTGTYVDGQRIQDTRLEGGCVIRLGEIEIEISNPNGAKTTPLYTSRQPVAPFQASPSDPKTKPEPEPVDISPVEKVFDYEFDEIEASTAPDLTDEVARLLNELAESKTENEVLRERLKTVPKTTSTSIQHDPLQAEMLDLMKQEIEALQQELEKRNSQDFSFDLNSETIQSEQLPGREEIEQLMDRLEELLDELEQKDEQIQVLQDLVLASDTANQAEQEEREQLTKWLGEFEERFELLSGEWQAENSQLKVQVSRLEEERTEALAALSSDTDSVKAETLKRITDSLRDELTERNAEIQEFKSTINELNLKLQEAEHSSPREEEIRLARERAEIARMRHDLEVRIQKMQKEDGETGEVEQKLKSLTDQLREPHRNEKSNSSLSGRFLSLWGRLNG